MCFLSSSRMRCLLLLLCSAMLLCCLSQTSAQRPCRRVCSLRCKIQGRNGDFWLEDISFRLDRIILILMQSFVSFYNPSSKNIFPRVSMSTSSLNITSGVSASVTDMYHHTISNNCTLSPQGSALTVTATVLRICSTCYPPLWTPASTTTVPRASLAGETPRCAYRGGEIKPQEPLEPNLSNHIYIHTSFGPFSGLPPGPPLRALIGFLD